MLTALIIGLMIICTALSCAIISILATNKMLSDRIETLKHAGVRQRQIIKDIYSSKAEEQKSQEISLH